MADVAERDGSSVIAVQQVPREQTASYGIVATDAFNGRCGRISAIVEKPEPDVAPSTLAVVGRYVLDPRIFALLETTRPGKGGEIQLTDGLLALCRKEGLMAATLKGERHDAGDRLGYLRANLAYALKRPDLADGVRAMCKEMLARA